MQLRTEQARERFSAAPVARLATADINGRPHVVPFTFVVVEDRILHVVDTKPKRSTALRRIANLRANPQASALVDHYEQDWSRLWWVRADGVADIVDDGEELDAGLRQLAKKYPAYLHQSPPGPMIALTVQRWTGWQASKS